MRKNKKGKGVSFNKRVNRAGYVFILPWILGFSFFFLRPLLESFTYTFNSIKMTSSGLAKTFVGFNNYNMMLFKDARFPPLLVTAAQNMISDVVIITIFSLFIATILNQRFKGRTFYRAVFFLPVIITSGVVFVMMQGVLGSSSLSATQNSYMFQSSGLRDTLLMSGVPYNAVSFITNIVDRIFSLTLKSGVQILLFLAGLQKIPQSSYEACKVEGATGWDSFWKITVPIISPMILLNIVYTIIDSFTAYGTETGGNTVMAEIQRIGFGKSLKFDYAATMSWIYFTMIIIFIALVYLFIGRRVSKIET